MSDLVPRDKHGQITLSKRPKRAADLKALLPNLDAPEGEIQRTSASSDRFKPLVSGEGWLYKQRDRRASTIIIVGMAQIFVLPIGLAGVFGAPEGINLLVGSIAAATELAWAPAIVFGERVRRAKQADFKGFLQWLHGRYGVTLNSKQGLPKMMSSKYPLLDHPNQSMQIVDYSGRRFKLHWNVLYHYFTLSEQEREPLALVNAQPARSEAVAGREQFSPQLRSLHRQIQERLTALNDRKLSPESDHVVARAKRDVAQIIALYADLAKFNALDAEQEQSVTNTFQSLISELTEVIKKETAFSLAALTVETTYVAARQERNGLTLKK